MTTLDEKLTLAFGKHRQGDTEEATKLYQDVLAIDQDNPDALHMLGVIAQQKNNTDLALKLMEAALAKKPDMALAWSNRALVLRVLKRHDDALTSVREAIKLDPHLANAWDLLGNLLTDHGDYKQALAAMIEALRLEPNNDNIINNTALTLLKNGNHAAAFSLAKKLEKSQNPLLITTLANILKACGYPERAIPYYQKVLLAHPDADAVRVNEATAWLQIGNFERGWPLWEQRPLLHERFKKIPNWQGQDVHHLFVYDDQGSGDAIQMARFLPLLLEKVSTLTLDIAPSLKSLFEINFPSLTFYEGDDKGPKADAKIRLMSLPALLKTTLNTLPTTHPYLHADDTMRMFWRQKLSSLGKPRIGLVWGGNPNNINDALRSIPFKDFETLLAADPSHFVSLQKGPQKNDAYLEALGILDADPLLADFNATASLLIKLDLVITVDTAMVHLAGALGVPVWMPTPFDPDFRWLIGREDSPWYPTLKLYRQTKPHQWDDVMIRTKADLDRLIAGDTKVLVPHRFLDPPYRQNPNALPLPF